MMMKSNGFTYMAVLLLVTITGISIMGAAYSWKNIVKREKEKEFFYRGDAIRRAIGNYYNNSPGGDNPTYPQKLDHLLKDPRYLVPKRYLRKLYKDPLTEKGEWKSIYSGGRIKGVFSISNKEPLKKTDFPKDYELFEGASSYSDWKFIYVKKEKK